jgi:hypothetical protein
MMDDVNYNLVHTLSVRGASSWHDSSYEKEATCGGCRALFERLRAMDEEALSLLTAELADHVRTQRFPVDLTD